MKNPVPESFALLIGAMKAGTTALYRYLEQHPQLAPCREKEPAFLSDPARWNAGLEAYQALWEGFDPARHRWAIEASTAYSKLPVRPNAVQATTRLAADFRFIYVVRDPIARIRSQYLHSLAEGWIDAPIHARLAPETVLFSSYAFQLAPYVLAHGRDSIHVLSYERFCAAPREELRAICAFLGIDPGFAFADPGKQNSSDVYRLRALARLAQQKGLLPGSIDPRSLRNPSEVRAPLAALHGPLAAIELLEELDLELERAITPSDGQLEAIHRLLDDDLARFADTFGIDPWTGAPMQALGACSAGHAL